MDMTYALLAFGEACDEAAADLSRAGKAPEAPPSPTFSGCLVPVELPPHAPLSRPLTADELGAALWRQDIDVTGPVNGAYGFRRGGDVHPPFYRSYLRAALEALRVHARGEPVAMTAVAYFAVSPWLAAALEDTGQIIKHTPHGVSIWGACAGDRDPATGPALARIAEEWFP
jgi:hypothetical protein